MKLYNVYAMACTLRNYTHEHPSDVNINACSMGADCKILYAFAFGNQIAIQRYAREFCTDIKDSSISTWKVKYGAEM